MTPPGHTAEPAPRFSVQVCMSPDPDPGPLGYIGYVPESDTEVQATTYEGARVRAIEAHLRKQRRGAAAEEPPADDGRPWTCANQHENPGTALGCTECGTPVL